MKIINLLVFVCWFGACSLEASKKPDALEKGTYSFTDPKTGAENKLVVDNSTLVFTDEKGTTTTFNYRKVDNVVMHFVFKYDFYADGTPIPSAPIIIPYTQALEAYPKGGAALYKLEYTDSAGKQDFDLVTMNKTQGTYTGITVKGPNFLQANIHLETDQYLGLMGFAPGAEPPMLPQVPQNITISIDGKMDPDLSPNAYDDGPAELSQKTWLKR